MLMRQKDQTCRGPQYIWQSQRRGERQAAEEGPDQTAQELAGLMVESDLYSTGNEEPLMV